MDSILADLAQSTAWPAATDEQFSELPKRSGMRVERIVSTGQSIGPVSDAIRLKANGGC